MSDKWDKYAATIEDTTTTKLDKWDKYALDSNTDVPSTEAYPLKPLKKHQFLRETIGKALPYVGGMAAAAAVPAASVPMALAKFIPLLRMGAASAGGVAGRIAEAPVEGSDMPSLSELGDEAGKQAMFQGVGEIPGVIGKALGRVSKGKLDKLVRDLFRTQRRSERLKIKAAEQAAPKRVAAYGTTTEKMKTIAQQKVVERGTAAQATAAEIKKTGGQLHLDDDIAGPIKEYREGLRGKPVSKSEYKKLREKVSRRIDEVLSSSTVGALPKPVNKTAAYRTKYSLEEAQRIKQAFDDIKAVEYEAMGRGAKGKQSLDKFIGKNLRKAIASRSPNITSLNQKTSAAIKSARAIERRVASRPTPEVATAMVEGSIGQLKAKIPSKEVLRDQIKNRLNAPKKSEGLVGIHASIPPMPFIKAPRDLTGKAAKILGGNTIKAISHGLPRTTALMLDNAHHGNATDDLLSSVSTKQELQEALEYTAKNDPGTFSILLRPSNFKRIQKHMNKLKD